MERVVNIFFGGHRLVGAWWGAALPMEGGGRSACTPHPWGTQCCRLGEKLAGQSPAELRLCSDFLPSPSPQMGLLRAGGGWEEKCHLRGERGIGHH